MNSHSVFLREAGNVGILIAQGLTACLNEEGNSSVISMTSKTKMGMLLALLLREGAQPDPRAGWAGKLLLQGSSITTASPKCHGLQEIPHLHKGCCNLHIGIRKGGKSHQD